MHQRQRRQCKGKGNCGVCSYEQERLPRVKTIHVKGVDSATVEDKEKYLFKPTFKPLWQDQVHSKLQHSLLWYWHLWTAFPPRYYCSNSASETISFVLVDHMHPACCVSCNITLIRSAEAAGLAAALCFSVQVGPNNYIRHS